MGACSANSWHLSSVASSWSVNSRNSPRDHLLLLLPLRRHLLLRLRPSAGTSSSHLRGTSKSIRYLCHLHRPTTTIAVFFVPQYGLPNSIPKNSVKISSTNKTKDTHKCVNNTNCHSATTVVCPSFWHTKKQSHLPAEIGLAELRIERQVARY